jgi:hypothetical protein
VNLNCATKYLTSKFHTELFELILRLFHINADFTIIQTLSPIT